MSPQIDLDGAASAVKTDKIQGQSGVVVTVPTSHTLAITDADRLTIAGTAVKAGALGKVLQVVNTTTSAVATGTTTLPTDDTIPQITEGDEYMTRAITPTNASNLLRIDVVFHAALSVADRLMCVALFQDSTAGALAAGHHASPIAGANRHIQISITHYMTAGTTSSTTFKIRAGAQSGSTLSFNGSSAGRFFGGVSSSSITITEIAA